jgi:hypothetical protein
VQGADVLLGGQEAKVGEEDLIASSMTRLILQKVDNWGKEQILEGEEVGEVMGEVMGEGSGALLLVVSAAFCSLLLSVLWILLFRISSKSNNHSRLGTPVLLISEERFVQESLRRCLSAEGQNTSASG